MTTIRAGWSTRPAPPSRHQRRAGLLRAATSPRRVQPRGTPEAMSFYDTAPLHGDAERLVDFDLLNSGAVRLSVGAVKVRTGNLRISTPPTRRSGRSTSWRAARCRPASRRSRSTASIIGTAASSPTRRLQYVLERERPAQRHVHLPGRPVQRRGALPRTLLRHRAARKGDPLLQPHAPQYRQLPRAAGHAPGHPSPAHQDARGAAQ